MKGGAFLHAVETVNRPLADTSRQFGDIWIYLVRTSDIFFTAYLFVVALFHLLSVFYSFLTRLVRSSSHRSVYHGFHGSSTRLPGRSQRFEGFEGVVLGWDVAIQSWEDTHYIYR